MSSTKVDQYQSNKSLTVLTYNTHLFKGSLASLGFMLGEHLEYKDEERAEAILNYIFETRPDIDIVCLQEVWGRLFQKLLEEKLKKKYNYTYVPPDERTYVPLNERVYPNLKKYVLEKLSEIHDPIKKTIMTGVYELARKSLETVMKNNRDFPPELNWKTYGNTSGLLIASRVPLSDITFETYNDIYDDESDPIDLLAKKGFVSFTANLPTEGNIVPLVRIATTHASTRRYEALKGIKKIVGQLNNYNKNIDWILLGDFNISSEDNDLIKFMSNEGAIDIVAKQLPKNEFYTTSDTNTFTMLRRGECENKPTHDNDSRIDYIYLKQMDKSRFLEPKPKGVTIPRNWTIKQDFSFNGIAYHEFDLSDHWPVIVEFDIVNHE